MLVGSTAEAQDSPCTSLPVECGAVDDRISLNRALYLGCEEICLVDELPAVSEPLVVDGSGVHTLYAGSHQLPAIDLAPGASLTVHGGVLVPERTLVRPSSAPWALLFDVSETASLTLEGTTVVFPVPEDAATRSSHLQGVVRQSVEDASSVVLRGVQLPEALGEVLVLQEATAGSSGTCLHRGSLALTGLDGAPSRVQLGEGGVLVAAVCWSDPGRSLIDGRFDAAEGGPVSVSRLQLSGRSTGFSGEVGGVPYSWATVQSVGELTLEESFLDALSVEENGSFVADGPARLEDMLLAGLELQGVSFVESPSVSLERGLACGLSADASSDPTQASLLAIGAAGSTARVEHLFVDGAELPLVRASVGGEVEVRQVTARAGGADGVRFASPEAAVRLVNSYLEGPWELGLETVEAAGESGDEVEGLRLAVASEDCPAAFSTQCERLEESALTAGRADCSEVLSEAFSEYATLSEWPARMDALVRLVPQREQQASLLAPGADLPTYGLCDQPGEEPESWDCADPFLVGAWSAWGCGLDALNPCPLTEPELEEDTAVRAPSELDDSGREAAPEEAAEQVHADFGCSASAAGLVGLLAPFGLVWRRRRTPPSRRSA